MPMKKLHLCSLTLASLIVAGCNKKPEAVLNAVTAPAVPSIPLIQEGGSKHFMGVASHLELGGASFNYADQGDLIIAIAGLLDEAMKNVPADQRKDLPQGLSFVNLFKDLGLDNVKAAGSSSRKTADGQYVSRSFAYMPEGRKGLTHLAGGPAEPLLLLQTAPAGTDLSLELPLHLKKLTQESLPKILALMPADKRAEAEAELDKPQPPLGLTARQMLEKLDARLALHLQVHPDQQLPLPGAEFPLPGADVMLVAERLGWLLEPVKQQFLPMLGNAGAPVEVKDENGILTVTLRQPAGPPPMDFQPVLRYDSKADRLLVASRPSFMKAALEGKGLISEDADFQKAWKDLPKEGNASFYFSPRFLKTAADMARQSASVSNEGGLNKEAMVKVLDFIAPYLKHGQAICLANLPDGSLGVSHLAIPLTDTSSLAAISTVSILASLAVPTFNVIGQKAKEQKISAQGRELHLALMAYAGEHNGTFPPTLDDAPGGTDLQFKEGGTTQWLYNANLTSDAAGSSVLLATGPLPGNKRCIVRLDGSTEVVSEIKFETLKEEGLIRR